MPANVETAVYANTPAWHREGTVLDTDGKKGLTIEQALPASGLDWEVAKVPVFGFMPSDINAKTGMPKSGVKATKVDGRYGVQRQTDGVILGTVGRTWAPVQNADGFALIDEVVAQAGGQVWIEAAGALDGGRKVWVLAHVDSDMQIAGEDYNRYILFTNGHDGRTSVTAAMMDVRVVCSNTLEWGLGQADQSGRVVRVRHTTKAAERIKEAHQVLGLRNVYAEQLAQQGEWLVEQEMSDGAFMDFLAELMPIEQPDTPAATMIGARKAAVADVWLNAENLRPIARTRWAAFNAVAEYCDHRRSFKDGGTQVKAQFGITAQPLKAEAFRLLSGRQA